VKTKIPPHDLGKRARDPGKVTHDVSCDVSHDVSRDVSRDPSPTLVARDLACDYKQAHDPTRFGRATRPLIDTWKTVGIN